MIKLLIIILLFVIMYMICNKKKMRKNKKKISFKKEDFIDNKKVNFNLDNNKYHYYSNDISIDDDFRNNYIKNINLFIPKNSNDELKNDIIMDDPKYINKNINDINNDMTNNKFHNISNNLNYLTENIFKNHYNLNQKYNNFDNYSLN